MDTTDSLGNGVGGGEILQFWGNNPDYNFNSPYLDNTLVRLYQLLPIVIAIIIGIIIFIMIRVLMNMYSIKSLRKGKGVISELDYIDKVRKRDAAILRQNKFIGYITKLVESTAFKSNSANKEYMEYNLERAGVKIPGGSRYMRAEEFNAVVVAISAAVVAVSLIVMLLANYALGIVMVIMTIVFASTMPMMYLRQTVKAKDNEIRENFSDFYLMLHYVLIAGAKTPLTGVMRSYSKTTDSKEMKHLVDVCIHYMETYGEYSGTQYIAKAYREIPSMGKLMRLIRQANEGGDIESELIGFRTELLNEKKYAIERRTDKLINRARASFNILMPILVQAIISAASIYLSDMGLIQTFVS